MNSQQPRQKRIRRAGLKSLRGKPEIHNEVKHSRSFYLSNSLLQRLNQEADIQQTSASEVLEKCLREAALDCRPIALLRTRQRLSSKKRTSFALTDTAYQVLQDYQRKYRLRSINAAAEFLLIEAYQLLEI